MSKNTILLLLSLLFFLCVSIVAAQTPGEPRQPGDNPALASTDNSTAPESESGDHAIGDRSDPLQAPQPGHPLDPHDVMVLTGKDKPQPQSRTYYYGYTPGYSLGYYRYGVPGTPVPMLDGSGLFGGPGVFGGPLLNSDFRPPLLFGAFNGRPFFILGDFSRTIAGPIFPGSVFSPFVPVTPVFGGRFAQISRSNGATRSGVQRK